MVGVRGEPQASRAFAMGNVGMASALRAEELADGPDNQCGCGCRHLGAPGLRWRSWRGRFARWSFAAAVAVAYVNHWPGGR